MDDRGVSMPLQYVLLLAIIAILSSGLFISTGGLVETQREDTVRDGLEVVGTRLASDLTAADALATDINSTGTLELTVDIPTTVGGSHYLISFSPGASPGVTSIRLESVDAKVIVTVDVVTNTDVATTTVDGGRLVIVYDDGVGLEVRDA